LAPVLFPDSAIAKKMACGRTKCEALVCNVLAPKSVEHVVADLTSGDVFKPKVFPVSTDASNFKKKTEKCFLCVYSIFVSKLVLTKSFWILLS
jgi:hypothetical protein